MTESNPEFVEKKVGNTRKALYERLRKDGPKLADESLLLRDS